MGLTHHEMRTPGRISIWLGDIADELELDEYLGEQFADDFGFEIYKPDGPEATAQQRTDVRILLEGFSQWQKFIDAAVKLASSSGVTEASAAIIFYHFVYDPDLIRNPLAPVRFIGTVPLARA